MESKYCNYIFADRKFVILGMVNSLKHSNKNLSWNDFSFNTFSG